MAFSFNTLNIPGMISGAITSFAQSAIIIGLPTADAPVPVFCLCEIPNERAHASVRLPGNLTQAGEFKARTVIEASTIDLDIILSDIPMTRDLSMYRVIQSTLNAVALVSNSLASFGAVLPNLAGLSVGYVASCISILNQIKNFMKPVMLLGSYIPLGVLQQTTPYLSSAWYIEEISPPHEAGQAGVAMTIRLREQYSQRSTSGAGAVFSVASEVAAPNGGVIIGGMF
ncbi:MAG: hypothetical protein M0R00_05485 [Candidatus Omnitrophica bacterium]|jgi:hypothetical protein|nr:hypothetical protein [Candidatus Omnitrophota bacterium]